MTVKRGRPFTYQPDFCDRVIEAGRRGKSLTWMAADLGVSRQTIYEWKNEREDFAEALELARTYSQQWWEDAGQDGMTAPGFGASVWSRSMAARFPEDWREVKGQELSGPNGTAIPIQTIERRIVRPDDTNG